METMISKLSSASPTRCMVRVPAPVQDHTRRRFPLSCQHIRPWEQQCLEHFPKKVVSSLFRCQLRVHSVLVYHASPYNHVRHNHVVPRSKRVSSIILLILCPRYGGGREEALYNPKNPDPDTRAPFWEPYREVTPKQKTMLKALTRVRHVALAYVTLDMLCTRPMRWLAEFPEQGRWAVGTGASGGAGVVGGGMAVDGQERRWRPSTAVASTDVTDVDGREPSGDENVAAVSVREFWGYDHTFFCLRFKSFPLHRYDHWWGPASSSKTRLDDDGVVTQGPRSRL